MKPLFIPPNKIVTMFYIGYYTLTVVQDGRGNVEVLHLTELATPNFEEE
jgi:hypothetical protein